MSQEKIQFMSEELKILSEGNHRNLCNNLLVDDESVNVWDKIANALIERRAESLRNLHADVEIPTSLDEIEEVYLQQTIDQWELEPGSDWNDIIDLYESSISNLSQTEREVEHLRIVAAKTIQLNKFLVTWQDIAREFESVGLINN